MKLSRKLSEKELAEYKVKILTRVSDIKDRKMIILRSRNNYTCINAETFSRFFSAFKMAVQGFCWSPSGRISWKSSQCVINMKQVFRNSAKQERESKHMATLRFCKGKQSCG